MVGKAARHAGHGIADGVAVLARADEAHRDRRSRCAGNCPCARPGRARAAVARDRMHLEAERRSYRRRGQQHEGNIAIDAALDFVAFGDHVDGFGDGDRAIDRQHHIGGEIADFLARRWPAGPRGQKPPGSRSGRRLRREWAAHGAAQLNLTVGTARSASFSSSKYSAFSNLKLLATRLEGKTLDRDVEIAHGAIVIAARHLDFVLDGLQRRPGIQEVRIGLEVGIGLGHGDQPAQGARQRAFGLGAFLGAGIGGALAAARASVTACSVSRSWAI